MRVGAFPNRDAPKPSFMIEPGDRQPTVWSNCVICGGPTPDLDCVRCKVVLYDLCLEYWLATGCASERAPTQDDVFFDAVCVVGSSSMSDDHRAERRERKIERHENVLALIHTQQGGLIEDYEPLRHDP